MQNTTKPFRLINPTGEHLTPEKLCALSGHAYPDEEALRIIDTLKALSEITLRSCRIPGTPIDAQRASVALNQSYHPISQAA